ncbi:MAG: glycosyltransferase [Enterococcus sp.]|nr:glycosyltransferase [Enterococcus sp.]
MPELPLVTIVTPSYNQDKYLEETINSVLKQTYPNIEYFIIDGGSSDNSVEIIKKYEDKLAWWVSEPDKGQSDALIKGFARAKGKYLAWLCSDDVLEPSMIKISVNFLEKYPGAVLTYGNRTRIDSIGNTICFSKHYVNNKLFRFGPGLPQETVVFRKEHYYQVGGINPDLQMVMDYDLWCKFYKVGYFLYIPAYLGRFRSHQSNKSTLFSTEMEHNGFEGKFTNEFRDVYKQHFDKPFSMIIRKITLLINSFIRLLLSQTSDYKMKKKEIKQLQNS